MLIRIKKGLDLPIQAKPEGSATQLPKPKTCALNLNPFDDIRFKVLVRVDEHVKIGQPLVESKSTPGVAFVSPGSGRVIEVRRGLKRRLLDIIIELEDQEQHVVHPPLSTYTKQTIVKRLMEGGAFAHIRMRPFNLVANPKKLPRTIFVKAIESAPFTPSAEMQVYGQEEAFAHGLKALNVLAPIQLVHREGSKCTAFTQAAHVERHSILGPHPAGNVSVHIHKISPILHHSEVVWTLSVVDVITIGELIEKGTYYTDRIIGIGGSGLKKGAARYVKARAGHPIAELANGGLKDELLCLISGDLLSGTKVEITDFLEFYHTTLSILPVNIKREPFHFLRPGIGKFTATRTYASGFLKKKKYAFDTNQHGEERAFIDGAVYNKVMPMQIPTMQLIKAILSEDYELAEQLGMLEVVSEDFALSTFICPSKIEMMDIVKQGLYRYSKELGF